jgi:hypothetical protein
MAFANPEGSVLQNCIHRHEVRMRKYQNGEKSPIPSRQRTAFYEYHPMSQAGGNTG